MKSLFLAGSILAFSFANAEEFVSQENWLALTEPENISFGFGFSDSSVFDEPEYSFELPPKSRVPGLKHSIAVRHGTPSSKQIYNISTQELQYQYSLMRIPGTIVKAAFESSVAKLNVEDMTGVIWGIGLAYRIPLLGTGDKFEMNSHTKSHYMTRYSYERKQYGGPVHWSYGMGFKYKMSGNSHVSYMWQHMSNADQYDENPNLETNTLSIGVNF